MAHGRRDFLKASGIGAASFASGALAVAGANDRLNVGVIGVGGMGSHHLKALAGRRDVRVTYVCDVDAQRLARAAEVVKQTSGLTTAAVNDLRRVLDDREVDAVFIATPDHWHAPAAIMALDAEKHVYVEKPCCHNIREGQLLVQAVRRTGKKLQVGTQSRSTAFIHEGIQRVLDGEIGDVLVSKAWNSQRRSTIGKSKPTEPPGTLDFDLWVGPAPMVEYRPNLLPAIWRWWHAFGCGDIGNDGVHDIDVALWGLGVDALPVSATCLGGKYFFDDDQQFPDTQYAVLEYANGDGGRRKQLIFEQRIWSPYTQEGYENGAAFYGTKGVLILGHTRGWRLYKARDELVAERKGNVDLPAHHQNFFDGIRGKTDVLNADVWAGHMSSTVVHLANISARLGRTVTFDPRTQGIRDDGEAHALVTRQYRKDHWAIPDGAIPNVT